jgi:hypothetical protein
MSLQDTYDRTAKLWVKRIGLSLRRNKRVVTGRTLRSLNYEITKGGFVIKGGTQFNNLISGRGSSKRKGDFWFPQLREWAIIKGFTLNETWAIYKSINANGWKTPPTPDLITSAVNQKDIKELKKEIAKNELSLAKLQIKKAIK